MSTGRSTVYGVSVISESEGSDMTVKGEEKNVEVEARRK
jgi:hypothetical protein